MKKKARKKRNYKKLADEQWSIAIREVGECEMCERKGIRGKEQGWKNLEAHHIIKREHLDYRHDLNNGICLCSHCHQWAEMAPHQDERMFLAWLEAERPSQYQWYLDSTFEKEKVVGNETFIIRVPIKIKRDGQKKQKETYQQAYERLKEISA